MQQYINLIIFVSACILLAIPYVKILRDYLRERKVFYVKSNDFLLMENDGNLISLTVENRGFEAHERYAQDEAMVMREGEG